MLKIIVILLVLWAAVTLVGFLIEAVAWLTIVGIVLFMVTAIVGWLKARSKSTKNRQPLPGE